MKLYIQFIGVFIFLQILLTHSQAQDTLHTHITVAGACGICQDRIETITLSTDQVYTAFWDQADSILHIDHHPMVDLLFIHQQLSKLGHATDQLAADPLAYAELPACCQYAGPSDVLPHKEVDVNEEENGNEIELWVGGICEMCKDRIEEITMKQPHVQFADWNVDNHTLVIRYADKFNKKNLQRKLARGGHDTELMKAPANAYESLHACCKYRDEEVIASHVSPANENLDLSTDNKVLQGIISELDATGKEIPIIGANVYWVGSSLGVVSDLDGYFSLDKDEKTSNFLVVSYIGYSNDTLQISDENHVEIVMSESTMMREVTITHRRNSTQVSLLSAGKFQVIGEKELLKAACCNLSESFDTNPTVDASVTDAVTGTRQIQMLGLAGPNIQITREGIPDIRGLSALYGLTFTPGTWIQAININTGTGSIVNGFESIAGQIDVSLKKPDQGERLYLNIYGNGMSRIEGNLNYSYRLNDKVSTAIMVHGSIIPEKHDNNHDGFLDHPLSDQFVGLNRWKFYGKNGLEAQLGVKITSLNNRSGQVSFDHDSDQGNDKMWGAEMNIRKYEGWAKLGKVFPSKPYASVGLQLSASYYDQEAYFGLRDYDGSQSSLYANLIYQSIIKDTEQKFKMGLSFQHDDFNENVNNTTFDRNESVPGAFFEYSWRPSDKISLVLGLRGDHHNNYGFFATPRLHFRYSPDEQSSIKLSGGRGQRTASIFAENIGAFASSRQIVLESNLDNSNPYGLDAEVSWSLGLNLIREFKIAERTLLTQFDVYHTNFQNQIVADFDRSPQALHFYNLDGESYSTSIQFQVDYELLPQWDVRFAYRVNDVKTTYGDETLQKPLTGRSRAFVNTQYTTKNAWSFDFTLNWQGEKRIPNTQSNPTEFQLSNSSPDYFLANCQISKSWNEKFGIYLGAMNLFDFRQDDPILSAEDPFSPYFDASLIWAPIFGREIYGGIRFKIL